MQIQKDRKIYLDALRIIACGLVIFNHLSGYTAYQYTERPLPAFVYMFFTMVTRINVPIFLMISGSLLLSKDLTYKNIFSKKIVRIVCALVCASFVFYFVKCWQDGLSTFNIKDFFYKLICGNICDPYWYLYAYLGFLLCLPLLRSIAKHLRHSDFILIIFVHFFISTFMVFLNYILSVNGQQNLYLSSDFSVSLMTRKAFFYPLVGYYIDHVWDINRINKKNIWLLPSIALSGILISSCFTYHQGIKYEFSQHFVETFDYVTAICVFIIIKYIFMNVDILRKDNFWTKAITLVGTLTFGIYLMDPVLQFGLKYFCIIAPIPNPVLFSIVWCIFSMCVCGLITFILKKIAVVKNIL